ncbi:hypothetical protein A1D31_39850 [Bradyrhizobium liaoningense]|nr:hypothetical protein A1D31_39850 [Bradyrhizobium liaoningense]
MCKVCRGEVWSMALHDGDEDLSERLSKEEGDALRNLLLYLRYVIRHQYVTIARKVQLPPEALWTITAGRSRGTKRIRDKIFAYAEDRRVPVEIATRLGAAQGFRSEIHVDDETLTKDSIRLAGRYLMYTLLTADPETIGVTLVSLYRKNEGDSLPEFAGWRPDAKGGIRNNGYYYLFDGALYLIGHTIATGYPRLLCLEPQGADGLDPFYGTVSSASREDLSFLSVCYLKKTSPLIRLRRQNWSMLGVFDLKTIESTEPDVAKALRGKRVLQIARRSTLHG